MNAKPILARRPIPRTVGAAVLSAAITIGLLTGVVELFQRDGTPFEQVVVAERACSDHAYVSEREACMRSYLNASQVRSVASR